MSTLPPPRRQALRDLARRLAPFAIIALLGATLTRLAIVGREFGDLVDQPGVLAGAIGLGLVADLAIVGMLLMPVVGWWLLLPRRWHGGRVDRLWMTGGFALFTAFVGFTAIAEQLFWSEFRVRFNFIAVDYLIYTQEVLGNIGESYPVALMLSALAAGVGGVTLLARRRLAGSRTDLGLGARAVVAVPVAAALAAMVAVLPAGLSDRLGDDLAAEVGRNGMLAFASAYASNEIDFRRFYATMDEEAAEERVEDMLAVVDDDRAPGHVVGHTVERDIVRPTPMQRRNVILVVMESMGADYLGALGDGRGLTPHLDRLAGEGVLFAKVMATGNRTVRGLEAITLSVPPTPGQSIIRRKDNGGLYSIGSVFQDFGYTTRFVYGGYGYFDNMNAFYEGNGFKVTDRSDLAKSEVGFGNVWGVADEDLFRKVIDLADGDHAAGRPFLQLVMTTSNHRPYTYPEGRIDIPSGSGRLGGVKYADNAIGQLVAAARTRPWFENTMFVFVADHTAGTSGRVELDPARYHIPFIAWAPGFIAPRRDERLASQIDVAPTVLGLVGASYHSRFMGADLTQANAGPQRAFVGTYQKIGLQRGGDVAVLGPKAMRWGYHGADKVAAESLDPALVADTIAAYQYAADWRHNLARVDARIARPAQP